MMIKESISVSRRLLTIFLILVISYSSVLAHELNETYEPNFSDKPIDSFSAGNPIIVSPGDDIQETIDSALPGSTILVDIGDYVGSINFHGKDITLKSIAGPDYTTITGDLNPIINIGPDGTLEGFTIHGGSNFYDAPIEVHGDGTLIKGNIIEDSPREGIGSLVGISGTDSSPTISNNKFRNNSCDEQPNSSIVRFSNDSSPRIINNLFYENQCTAINMTQPTGTTPEVINNTIVSNRTGIVVRAQVNSKLQVYRNNIVVNNTNGVVINSTSSDYAPTWENNLVYGNVNNYVEIADQTGTAGNISTDPHFHDPDNRDFRLKQDSAAIDAGSMNGAPLHDFDGFPRPTDGDNNGSALIDLGAFERGYIAKKLVHGQFEPDETITYTLIMESEIETSAAPVSITDEINNNLTVLPGSLYASNGLVEEINGVISWTGSVEAKLPTTVSYNARINQDAPRGTSITNNAEVNWNGTILNRRSSFYIPLAVSYLPCITRNYCPHSFQDDFSNLNSGWPIGADDDVVYEYISGEYRILLKQPNMLAAARKFNPSENYHMGVDVRNNYLAYGTYGIIFNIAEDWSHFYSFEVDPDGYYGIWRYSDANGWDLLYVNYSPYIKIGKEVNQLEVKRYDSLIQIYANNHLLTSVHDDTFVGKHYVGLIVTSFTDQVYLDVRFDNFYITPKVCSSTSSLAAPQITSSSIDDRHLIIQEATKDLH